MKYLQETRKSIYLASAFLGALLVAVPVVAMAQPEFSFTGSSSGQVINANNNTPNTLFNGNFSGITGLTNSTTQVNFAGTGGNDTFVLFAGNDTTLYTATGFLNNTFDLNSSDGPGSTFSMISGANSTFLITEGNVNNTQAFLITGGANSLVNESSAGSIGGPTLYSVNLGGNSTVQLNSDFEYNGTTINVVF